jgi:two-component system CheB/CheR fusion protein
MDGYELARRLRELPAMQEVVLVAVTGYAREEDKRRADEARFNLYLVKPVEPERLEKLLATLT